MDISRIRALRGPNLWSRFTVIEAVVTSTDADLNGMPLIELTARMNALCPGIGTPDAVPDNTAAAPYLLGWAMLRLQQIAGCPVRFWQAKSTSEPGVCRIVVEYSEEAVGRLALESATLLFTAARDAGSFDASKAIGALSELDEDIRLGPSTGSIVQAAIERGIPYRRLTQGSLVQFGWGIHQRRIQAAEIDSTGAIAESIAQDKELSKTLLDSVGVPVPNGRSVTDLEEAWTVMQSLNAPVVVKPRDGNQGKGVTVDVDTREELEAAWAAASEISSDIIVERYLSGDDYRLLIVGRKLIAAARRDPPLVIGDGQHSVAELVEQVNSDPRRGDGHATPLTRIRFDAIALARLAAQGMTAESIPERGCRVILRNNANLSTGGTATDVTDEVHPQIAARAIEAAHMVGLDVCGVDVVCRNIAQPLEDQGGGIVEVNAAPGLRMHLAPSFGKPRPLGEAIIGTLFPDGHNGRIPTVAVTGTNGKTTTVRLITHLLAQAGLTVGMTNTDGVFVGNQQTDSGDCSGPKSARSVLLHPDAQAAVFEVARGGLLREGLGFDRCEVGIITNIGQGDHIGLNFIESAEDVAAIKSVVARNVSTTGVAVLNANDPLCVAMADDCPGAVTFFGDDGHHPVIAAHRAKGQRVVFIDGDAIVAAQGNASWRFAFADIPLTRGGRIGFQNANAMAAIAAAWALKMDWAVLRRGLASFVSDAGSAPGRFNVFEWRGATIIADYGHNPDAIQALVDAVAALPAERRSVVISGAGDRRDEDLRRQTQILGDAFDDVILYQDAAQRGRSDGEVIALLREGLADARRTRRIDEIRGEFIAIDLALERLRPGDLSLILVDQVQEALEHIAGRIAHA
jgi:cyanophycin synthetase